MDKAAQQGNPSTYHLPKPKVEGSPYDFSFSGLKTAVINTIHNANQKGGNHPKKVIWQRHSSKPFVIF